MAAHNTLRVDARDPCVFAGRFMALTQPRVTVQRRGADAIAASHDGYTRLTDPVRHAREVRLTASELVIADRVECRGEHLFELRFHCHPDVSVTVDADGATLALGAARFRLDLDGDLEVRLYLR